MRQLFLDKGQLLIKKVAEPLLEDTMVLVAVHYSCIDAMSDLSRVKEESPSLLSNIPHKVKKVLSCVTSCGVAATKSLLKHKLQGDLQPLGYSCCGQVVAVGKKVTQFRSGDWVACAGAAFAHHADIVCVPEYLMAKLTDSSRLKAASMTAIGGVALHSIRRAKLALGDVVAVFGLGLVGQLTVLLAKAAGCTVIAVDDNLKSLEQIKALGADHVFDSSDAGVGRHVSLVTQHAGVDASFVVGVSEKENSLLQQIASEVTRSHGKIVIVGQESCTVHRHHVQKKNLTVLLSLYTPGKREFAVQCYQQDRGIFWTEQRTMQEFVRLLESGQLPIDCLMGKEVAFHEFPSLIGQPSLRASLSILIAYHPQEELTEKQTLFSSEKHNALNKKLGVLRFIPAIKNKENKLRVGIIGAGRFARAKLMPILADTPDISLDAVVDIDRTRAVNMARIYGIENIYTSDDALYANHEIDAVVIASPFTLHAKQIMQALGHGKAVYVEKPFITDAKEYEEIKKVLDMYPHAPLCVGFNDSFSPFMQKIKKHVQHRYTPLMISCRMNPGLVPPEFWIHADLSVGKILGHACGLFDLFCFLTGARPVSVSVEALHAAKADIFPTDNFCVQISFDDGSVCSLVYTTLGHQELGRERYEIFFDGKSILMSNYNQLLGFGFPTLFNETVSAPDKGHRAALTAFFDAIKKPQFEPPVPFDRLKMAAELTLLVDQLVCSGGGSADFVPAKAAFETGNFSPAQRFKEAQHE